MSFDINRIIRIIHKYKILAGGFCNRRIRRRIYIGYDHRMIVTFCHFQLCPQNRIVQRRRYLTDTAADAVYHLAVQIRTRHLVTIFGGEGLHCIIGRKRIAGIQGCSVDQAAAICNVFAAGRTGGRIACRKCSEHIFYLRKLFCFSLGLITAITRATFPFSPLTQEPVR